jgi:hypothetical protein
VDGDPGRATVRYPLHDTSAGSCVACVITSEPTTMLHALLSSIIHGLIYATIFKIVRHLGLPATLVFACVGIVAVFVIAGLTRGRRRRW